MTAVAPRVDQTDTELDEAPRRKLTPRRVWPGSRATVGGLLVAVAALGLYAAVRSTKAPPTTLYVVAREPIAPGTVIGTEHVGAQRMELPSSLAEAAFTSFDDDLVIGSVAIEAVASGELVQRSDVRPIAAGDTTPFEMSFRIDADRAVAGSLRAGERVDVLATRGNSADAPTEVVERNLVVIAIERAGDSSLAGERQVITVALDTSSQAIALAGAVDTATVTLVRTMEPTP